jgi:hypothetical protein
MRKNPSEATTFEVALCYSNRGVDLGA